MPTCHTAAAMAKLTAPFEGRMILFQPVIEVEAVPVRHHLLQPDTVDGAHLDADPLMHAPKEGAGSESERTFRQASSTRSKKDDSGFSPLDRLELKDCGARDVWCHHEEAPPCWCRQREYHRPPLLAYVPKPCLQIQPRGLDRAGGMRVPFSHPSLRSMGRDPRLRGRPLVQGIIPQESQYAALVARSRNRPGGDLDVSPPIAAEQNAAAFGPPGAAGGDRRQSGADVVTDQDSDRHVLRAATRRPGIPARVPG